MAGAINNKMTDSPLVSVVIPLFNKRPYILRAIKSVQEQTFTNWELIIVNDGSTDSSSDVIPCDDPKIRLIHQENKGPGPARNHGIAQAKGKYVAFLDADDEWLPTFLETGLSFLEDTEINATVACTGYIKYPEKINCFEFLTNMSFIKGVYEISGDSELKEISNILIFMWTSATIARTDTVKRWGGFFDRFKCLQGEDWHLQIKLIFNERIVVIPEAHSLYHTESSDLYGGGDINNQNPELTILDLDDLLNSCPESKRHLLIKILLRKVLGASMSIALKGNRKKAREVLSSIYPLYHTDRKKFIMARIIAEIAPILPFVHWIWRKIKYSIINRDSKHQKKVATIC